MITFDSVDYFWQRRLLLTVYITYDSVNYFTVYITFNSVHYFANGDYFWLYLRDQITIKEHNLSNLNFQKLLLLHGDHGNLKPKFQDIPEYFCHFPMKKHKKIQVYFQNECNFQEFSRQYLIWEVVPSSTYKI